MSRVFLIVFLFLMLARSSSFWIKTAALRPHRLSYRTFSVSKDSNIPPSDIPPTNKDRIDLLHNFLATRHKLDPELLNEANCEDVGESALKAYRTYISPSTKKLEVSEFGGGCEGPAKVLQRPSKGPPKKPTNAIRNPFHSSLSLLAFALRPSSPTPPTWSHRQPSGPPTRSPTSSIVTAPPAAKSSVTATPPPLPRTSPRTPWSSSSLTSGHRATWGRY